MNLNNVNSVEELMIEWRALGYDVECIAVRAGVDTVYYIGVDDDKCSYSLSNALFALSEKLQCNIMYHVEYPDKFAEVRKEVIQIG